MSQPGFRSVCSDSACARASIQVVPSQPIQFVMSQPGPGLPSSQSGSGLPSSLLFVSLGLGFHPVCFLSAWAWAVIVSLGLGFHRQPGPGHPSSLL